MHSQIVLSVPRYPPNSVTALVNHLLTLVKLSVSRLALHWVRICGIDNEKTVGIFVITLPCLLS
jgi:hypothetical protein